MSLKPAPPEFILDGGNIHDVASFYDEINRVFMADEDWKLGQSLDALDDMLYGSYGALAGRGSTVVIWRKMAKNRADLGLEATRRHYLAKLEQPTQYNSERVRADLAALESGEGPTFFEIVEQIFSTHSQIEIRPA